MNEYVMLITEYDDAGNIVGTEPVLCTIVNTPEELAALLDAAANRTTAHGVN